MRDDCLHPEIARLAAKLAEEISTRVLLTDPELEELEMVLKSKRGCRR